MVGSLQDLDTVGYKRNELSKVKLYIMLCFENGSIINVPQFNGFSHLMFTVELHLTWGGGGCLKMLHKPNSHGVRIILENHVNCT
jgi:hypothetical protein